MNPISQENSPVIGFDQMNLKPLVIAALKDVGYDTPTPIQALAIPQLAAGKDLLGQARTGTGKTAAFALPLLGRIDVENRRPQVLVLTPTRELAIQVADSFSAYGRHMRGLSVLPVYGGQSYGVQLNRLKQGAHVVVGTPGRLMDHLKRKTISFSDLMCVVLDEADEMLHMGFIDDVDWILDKTPGDVQSALFSATMPGAIRKIAQKYLKDPEQILVRQDTAELGTIDQYYWMIGRTKKAEALIRMLDSRPYDGVIVFTKTKTATTEVAKALESKGFRAEALNGDMAQAAREQAVNRLKTGRIDILVATDVAARGLDVDRISHVINYDMPAKVEPYIHRIGRTGRAGRTGEAILFLKRNERWMLRAIQKQTRKDIKEMVLPSNAAINKNRIANFTHRLTRTLAAEGLTDFESLVEDYARETGLPVSRIAAALAKMAHGNTPFLMPEAPGKNRDVQRNGHRENAPAREPKQQASVAKEIPSKQMRPPKQGMERYRIEVGSDHGLRPKDLVGAISNEAGLEGRFIGPIRIDREASYVDLPFGMPKNIYRLLKRTWVRSRRMAISKCA